MLKHGGIFYFSYSMHIQRVHSKVIGVLIETVENLLESHLLSSLFQHHTVSTSLICFLDEGQQVFLRHAGSCMNMRVHLIERNNVYVQSTGQIECLQKHTWLSPYHFIQIVKEELTACTVKSYGVFSEIICGMQYWMIHSVDPTFLTL